MKRSRRLSWCLTLLMTLPVLGAEPQLVVVPFQDVNARATVTPSVTLTVLNFQNRQTGDGYEWLQRAFPDMLLTHFVQHGKFTVVERERMQVLLDELKLAQTGVTRQDEAAKFAGIAKVQKVVYGHYAVEHGRLSVTAFIFDATSNTVDAVATAEGGLDSLCDIEHQLFANLLGRLGAPLTESDQGKLRCVVSSSLSAAAHFYEGMGAFDAGDYPEALVQFQQAGRQDPRYGEARLWAARMYSYLGEPMHGVIELRQFTSNLPDHPLAAQARLRIGLTLLQDLQQPRLAVVEFEQLVALAPETGITPVELRQAHLDEYLTLYRSLWRYWNPKAHTASAQNSEAVVKLESPGKERAQKLDVYVEGWLRLGQAAEAAGDLLQAFRAYDQGRAVCRWLLLDQSKLTDQLYDATRAMYQRLLLTDGITVPTPDWALPMAGDQPHQIFGDNLKELCQYKEGKGPVGGTERMVLLAPPGQEFDTITLSVPVERGGVIDLARPRFVFRSVKMANTNGLGKAIVKIGKPFDYRAAEIVVNREPDESIAISATYRPWKAIHHPKFSIITSSVLVHTDPTNAVVLIDDQLLKTNWMGGYTLSPRPHRIAAISDGRTNAVVLQCQTNAQHQVFLALDSPWRDTGVRLPPGRYPDICRAPDGQYWLVFVPSKLDYDKEKGMFIHDDSVDEIWLTKSRDLREWTPPVRLSINSPESNRMPRLTLLPDGRMQLVFLSDRRRSGTPGLYLSESSDSRAWSPPRWVADVAKWYPSGPQTLRDANGRYWLLYRDSVTRNFALRQSSDGINWKESLPAPFESIKRPDWEKEGIRQWSSFSPQLFSAPNGGLGLVALMSTEVVSKIGTNRIGLTFTTTDGRDWQMQPPVQLTGGDWACVSSPADSQLIYFSKPKLQADFSPVIKLADGTYAMIAGQTPGSSAANIMIYTATEEELRPYLRKVLP